MRHVVDRIATRNQGHNEPAPDSASHFVDREAQAHCGIDDRHRVNHSL